MPLSPAQLLAEQSAFLAKFHLRPQQPGWQAEAYRDAMTSATRRARLYRKGRTQAQRNAVRQGWQAQLAQMVNAYVVNGPSFATQAQFLSDVAALRQFMNATYGCDFNVVTIDGYPAGFRIAHAQKSLSLVLKHYWCHGVVDAPPCCPVDRRILVIAGASARDAKWTHIDSLPAYLQKLTLLSAAAAASSLAPISLAEWELEAFN